MIEYRKETKDRAKNHKRQEWSTEEISVLEKHYNQDGIQRCVDLLPTRTMQAIQEMARRIGVARKRGNYTQAELEAIKQGFYDKIEGRTLSALKTMRSRISRSSKK